MFRFIHLQSIILLTLSMFVCNDMFAIDRIYDENKQYTDSLKNILKTQLLTNEQQLDIYHKLLDRYASHALDSVLVYAPKAVELAQKLKDREEEIYQYNNLGVVHCFKNNYDTAFLYLEKAKKIAVESGSKQSEARIFELMAFVYTHQGKYITSIDYYLKALAIYESITDKSNEAKQQYISILTNLGELNRKLDNTQVAIQYLDKAADVCEEIKLEVGWYKWRITQIYNEYATIYLEQGYLDKALEYALKADNTYTNAILIINKCHTKGLLAKIYLRKKNYTQALQYASEAMEQADILKDKTLYVNTWLIFSDIYLAQGNYEEAETEAFNAWKTDSTNIDESRKVAANIAMANIYMHNEEKAAYYFEKYQEMNRQYSEKSFQTTVSDMTVKYETDKKEMRISVLEGQKYLYIAIGIAGVLLAVALWVIFRQKVRQEKQEKRLVASQAVFEGEKEERRRLARDLHDGLGGMLSAVKLGLTDAVRLQDVRKKLDYCIEELGRMAHHLMPASLSRFGLKAALEDYCRSFSNVRFHFFGKESRIDERIELVIYYCAYELINNSFKHSGSKHIYVQLVQDSERVSLAVQDDGRGFDKDVSTKGTGLKNLFDRVAAFNGTMDIITSPDNGTEINIELKIENKI